MSRPVTNKPPYVWIFDINRRVYPPKEARNGGPIYREHWHKVAVTGETRVSWLLKNHTKVKKTDAITDDKHVEDDVYVQTYKYHISEQVRQLKSAKVLSLIANILSTHLGKVEPA